MPHKKYVEKKWKAICCLPCEGLVKNWTILSSEDERRFLITSQGTGPVIQDGNEVTIRVRYPGKDGKPEKFDELKTFLVTKADTGFRGLRQGSSLIIACNGEKKLLEFVEILLVTKLKP